MGHGKTVCKVCERVVSQCKCMKNHMNVTEVICDDCKAKDDLTERK